MNNPIQSSTTSAPKHFHPTAGGQPMLSKSRSISTAPNYTRKNQIAYMKHVEIETVNRKLLDNLSKIMQNDYKSAVKTAISNPPRKITSLNARARKENLQRIANENQAMLNRLIRGKSTFSV